MPSVEKLVHFRTQKSCHRN